MSDVLVVAHVVTWKTTCFLKGRLGKFPVLHIFARLTRIRTFILEEICVCSAFLLLGSHVDAGMLRTISPFSDRRPLGRHASA